MQLDTSTERHGRRQVAAVFAAAGMLMSSWFVRVPVIQDALTMSDAALGLALSAMSVGVLVALPVVGSLATIRRSRWLILLGTVVASAMLVLAALVPHVVALIACLVGFGLAYSCIDISSNTQGIRVQTAYGRSLMVGFHAWWSIGSLAGAGLGALSLALGMSTTTHFALVAGAAVATVVVSIRGLRADAPVDADAPDEPTPRPSKPFLALPRGVLLPIAVAGFGIAVGESLGRNWSGVFLRDAVALPLEHVGWGLVALNVSMVAVRLVGDRVTDRVGASRTLAAGAWLAAGGVLLAAAVPAPITAILGFLLLGAGVGAGIPLCFAAAGRRAESAGQGVAAVATLSYAAFLVSSPAVGALNDWLGIRWSLAIGAIVIVVAAGRRGLLDDERPRSV